MKRHLIAFLAIPLLLGLMFAAILPASGYSGMLVAAEDESDEISETETTEVEDENDEEDEHEDEDEDGVEDDEEELNERKLQIEVSDKEVQIQSELKNGENKDEIEIELKTTDEPEIQVEYESEVGSSETELSFKVRFYSLIEYNDMDSDGIYNESTDELVQELRLDDSNIGYLPIEYTTEMVGNTTLHIINVSTTDGVFSLQFYIAEEFTLVNGSLVTPSEMKIDIAINEFPFENDSSLLSLKVRLEAEVEYELDEETEDEEDERASDEIEVEVSMNGFTGFFSWSEIVHVDGVPMDVKSSSVDDDDVDPNEQKIYLNYPRGTRLLHDPKIGVAGILQVPSATSDIPGFESIITLFAVFFASVIMIYRRKR
jgi:hypothetical protein